MSKSTKVRYVGSRRLLIRNKVPPPHETGGGTLPSSFPHTLLSLGDDRCFKQSNAFQNSSSLRFGKNDHLETHLKFVFEEVKTSDGHDPQARARQLLECPLNRVITDSATNLFSNHKTTALIPHAWPTSFRKRETSRTRLLPRSESPIGPRRTNLTS